MKEFKFLKKKIGNYEIIPIKKKDFRGYLSRIYCEKIFKNILKKKKIVQINHTLTKKSGTIRGFHFQEKPFQEDKIVLCIKGKIYDVALDLRKNSKHYLCWDSLVLDEKLNNMHYIPRGYAHGYKSLKKNCELIYFHTNFFSKKKNCVISPFDKKLKINWPIKKITISSKDKSGKLTKTL